MFYPEYDIVILAVILLALTTFAATRSITLLTTSNAVCMVCGPLFGNTGASAFSLSTHVGNVYFAVVIYGITIQCLFYGIGEARKALGHNLFALVIVFSAIFALQEGHTVGHLYNAPIQVAGARFVSFYLIQSFFYSWLQRRSWLTPFVRIPLIMMVLETLDGVLFFPAGLLGTMPGRAIFYAVMTGVVVRCIATAVSFPFLAVSLLVKGAEFCPSPAAPE